MLPEYQHTGKFDAWWFRIAANIARDRARKMGRHRQAIEREFPYGVEGPRSSRGPIRPPRPEDELDRHESEQRLQECLSELSESEREVILLRHYSDLSFREIAGMLEIPLGTALSRAHRALARMREQLGDWDGR